MSEKMMKVKLKSNDGIEFLVEKSVAFRSTMIQNAVGCEDSSVTALKLPEVNSGTLSKVINYLKNHPDGSGLTESEQEKEKLDDIFADEDINVIVEVMMASNYLGIPDLEEKMIRVVAKEMESKSIAGIRKMFSINESGFSQDEEARVRRQRDWDFEEGHEEVGQIGCMVDTPARERTTRARIKLHGGIPANVITVGGIDLENQIVKAFKELKSGDKVKAILVNIYGNTMKCDVIATRIVNAAEQVALKVPVVVCLRGANVDQGKRILEDSGMVALVTQDLDDAAKTAVKAAAS